MTRLGHDDPFGSLAALPDGVVLPELTPAAWHGRHNLNRTLPFVAAAVRATGLAPWIEERIAEDKKRKNPDTKQGRTRGVTVEAVLVAMLMLKMTNRALTHAEASKFLLHTLDRDQRLALGVPDVAADPPSASPEDRCLLDREAVEARVARLWKRIDDLLNPSEYRQPRTRAKIDKEALRRADVTPADLARARERLDWVVVQLTAMPIKAMPRWLRRQWTGDAAVDDTHVALASRGDTRDRNAWDIDGGPYVRTRKKTSDRDAKPAKRPGKGTTKTVVLTKYEHSVDLSLVVACDATPGPRQYFPTLPLGIAAHAPSTDPSAHAKRVFEVLADAGVRKRHMAEDRLYPHQGGDAWHAFLTSKGWSPTFDFRVDNLGRQGVAKGGPLLVEGAFHCPMTPETAIEATADLRAGKIDHASYEARMEQRALHRLHIHEKADANGTIRVSCQASGNAPKMTCPLRKDSLKPHVIRQPDGSDGDTRQMVKLLPTRFAEVAKEQALADAGDDDAKRRAAQTADYDDGTLPNVCCKTSVSVRREVLARHRQELVYGSDDHKGVYRAARNAQEGFHGFAKDDAYEAIGKPGLRRKRGLAAQSRYAAVGLAVAALRKIVSFLEHKRQDAQGRWYVPRKPRPGSSDLALGEGGGYADDDDWPPDDEDQPPDRA